VIYSENYSLKSYTAYAYMYTSNDNGGVAIWTNFVNNAAAQVTITITAGPGGTVTPSGPQIAIPGNTYTVTATANQGNKFSYWSLNGANIGTTNPLQLPVTLSMNGQTLTANFVTTTGPATSNKGKTIAVLAGAALASAIIVGATAASKTKT
jgi:hypothetical protein